MLQFAFPETEWRYAQLCTPEDPMGEVARVEDGGLGAGELPAIATEKQAGMSAAEIWYLAIAAVVALSLLMTI